MSEQSGQPVHVNVFLKGIMQDIDINEIPPEKYLMGEDIKLLDKEGQGYVATNVDGNLYAFSLTNNFVPIGYEEHKDIMYIISCNRNGLGEGEIGTFPSPDPNNPGKWLLQYSPLKNYSDNRVGKVKTNLFRTDLFNMDRRHRVEIVIKDSYDGSVNLYFADGKNQIRVANSGFDQKGKRLFDLGSPPYTNFNFSTKINLILGSRTSPVITTNAVTTGGNLKYGNYIFFVKYVTTNFDETFFVAESNPVPVFYGINTVGSVRGGSASLRSDKKVQLLIENIDDSYKFIRIGYVRHFSDYNGVPTYEFGEIFNRYEIQVGVNSLTVDIIGTEGEKFLSEEEILLKKDTEIIPLSITQLNNRLWGANWKTVKTHDVSLERFAKKVKIGYEIKEIPAPHVFSRSDSVEDYQYADYKNYDYVGYFRGEAYPFALIAELNDGSYSEAYPLNGADMWANLTPQYDPAVSVADKANYNGIYRFPSALEESTISPPPAKPKVRLMGVKFDLEAAWETIMAANENNWIRFNVRSIHMVRGDRYRNLKYQGLMMSAAAPFLKADEPTGSFLLTEKCSTPGGDLWHVAQANSGNYSQYSHHQISLSYDPWGFEDNRDLPSLWWGNRSVMTVPWPENPPLGGDYAQKWGPVMRGYAPAYSIVGDATVQRAYMTRYFLKPDKYCFYSPDMLFRAFNDTDDIQYCWRVAKTITARPAAPTINTGSWTYSRGGLDGFDLPVEDTGGAYYQSIVRSFVSDFDQRKALIKTKVMVGEGSIVKPSASGYYDFINGADDPFQNSQNTWHWWGNLPMHNSTQWYNRSMVMAKYLGIDFDNVDIVDGALGDEDFNLDIVNLYGVDPDSIDIRNLFPNLNAIHYSKISEPILVSSVVAGIIANDWNDYKAITAWRGDCFLQRTHFKQMSWAGDGFLYFDDSNSNAWRDENTLDKNTEIGVKRSHGLVLGIVTENEFNSAMRSEEGTNSFYPASNIYPFAVKIRDNEHVESFKMNYGYSKTLSPNRFFSFDSALPDKEMNYMTRLRYSDATVPGSFIDSYRTFRVNNYVDFDTDFGPIIKIATVFDRLVSVQTDAIIEHYVNERQTIDDAGAQSAVLGYGNVLSPSARKMSNFGSQHKWSIVESDALFGVDWKRQVIWEVSLQRSDAGTLFLDARDISKHSSIEKWMREISLEISNNRSDKFNEYGDDTMNGEGVVSGVDAQTGDIYFVFHKLIEE